MQQSSFIHALEHERRDAERNLTLSVQQYLFFEKSMHGLHKMTYYATQDCARVKGKIILRA